MLRQLLTVIYLTILFVCFINGGLLCGTARNFSFYNAETHLCLDGKLVERTSKMFLCGKGLQKYDKLTHICENGTIILRPPSVLTTSGPQLSPKPTSACREKNVLVCDGNVYCGDKGAECCGFYTFYPEKQTCCHGIVHDNKPQRKHICCHGSVYRRRKSNAPCQHPSRNDDFLGRHPKKLKNRYIKSVICNDEFTFVYHLRVFGPFEDDQGRYLAANISMYNWQSCLFRCRRAKKQLNIRIPLDKYSYKRLLRKTDFIWSNYRYLDDAIFYRRRGDVVFKAPRRQRSVRKKLREVKWACQDI